MARLGQIQKLLLGEAPFEDKPLLSPEVRVSCLRILRVLLTYSPRNSNTTSQPSSKDCMALCHIIGTPDSTSRIVRHGLLREHKPHDFTDIPQIRFSLPTSHRTNPSISSTGRKTQPARSAQSKRASGSRHTCRRSVWTAAGTGSWWRPRTKSRRASSPSYRASSSQPRSCRIYTLNIY